MYHKLLLASKSSSRRELLNIAQIPYVPYDHLIDERAACSWELPLEELVVVLARHKMAAVSYTSGPHRGEHPVLFVLTADTLTQDVQGVIHGKPASYDDAFAMLAAFRDSEATIATGFRLERRIWEAGVWTTERSYEAAVRGTCLFSVPDQHATEYLRKTAALQCAGGMEIEGYGLQFVKHITGSYSAIMGLPLFEVREALEKMGFFCAQRLDV